MNADAPSGAATLPVFADGRIEHRGVVQRVDGGRAAIAMETAGCCSCGQLAGCGIGRMASGRLAASALLGYFFPALAMLLGAWAGAALDGSDGATAAGAIGGFFGALALSRLLLGLLPGLAPAPRIVPVSRSFQTSSQE